MGEAYTAMADDVSSLYWNPAGIAILNQSQASFMYTQWLKDLQYHNASVAMPLENGGIGASVSYLS
jgi:long-subunit fatty acid transport protein